MKIRYNSAKTDGIAEGSCIAHEALTTLQCVVSHSDNSIAAGSGSLLALHALDVSLYSEALTAMTNTHELQNQLMALAYRLSWGVKRSIQLAEDYTIWDLNGDAGSQTSSDYDAPEAESAAASGDAATQQSSDDQVCPCTCTSCCTLLQMTATSMVLVNIKTMTIQCADDSRMCRVSFWHMPAS